MTNLERQKRFIEKAKEKYGDKYDYSKVNYVDTDTPVCIICPKHGEFLMSPSSFLHRNCYGCHTCKKEKNFIEKANEKYANKYDYSKVKYVDAVTPVCIICPIHGEFWQTPNHHLNTKYGCPKCADDKERFIQKANMKYNNKFDYSKANYINNRVRICITCPIHGDFEQTPSQHLLTNYGCPKCANSVVELRNKNQKRKTTKEFIEQARKIHGDKYDYSKVEYKNAGTKVCIICPEHGEFWQRPINHLSGSGCVKCGRDNAGKKLSSKAKKSFFKKAFALYGNRYDYSEVNSIISDNGVLIFDNEKQIWFIQKPKEHLKGNGYTEANIMAWYQANNDLRSYYYRIAQQYEDLYDLYRKHKKIFYSMKKNNYLKDYKWLKNNREVKIKNSVVYSYEFSDHSVYIGLTNSLDRRDQQHRERRYHSNGKPQYDGVLDYSLKHNIEIPEVKILINNLTREESGLEEIKWIQYYKDNGWNLINRNKGGSIGSYIIKDKWTNETVIEEAKKYKSMQEMYRENRSAYNYMSYNNLKKECFPNAKLEVHQPNRIYTKELIEETVKKYPLKKDLRNMDVAMYMYLHNHNMIYDYYPKGKSYGRYDTKESIESVVKQYPRKSDLKKHDKNMYKYLYKHNLLCNYYPNEINAEPFSKK